jgi:cell division septum initiation protein DivIVA
MDDIADQIRVLHGQMLDKHHDLAFRVEQLAQRLAEQDDAINQRLAEIHQQQLSRRETARLLLTAIAETANIQPARQIHTHRIEDEPFDAPRMFRPHPAAEEVDRIVN